jgi:hypothetical protein
MASTDLSALDALIRKLRRTRAFVLEAAPACAAAVAAELRASAAAGTTPDGASWAPRKADGARALPDAASSITVKTVGSVVLATVGYPYVFHNNATVGGSTPRRQILPSGALPAALAQAIRRTLIAAWEAA